ncbi:MAG: acyltransferase [Nitrospira sp. CG24D]|nr:MAG: acyltransferase [Nitrospira sp. CG24D]
MSDPVHPYQSANLNVLRAIAVLFVYIFHLSITIGTRLPDAVGQFGVLLFFVHTSLVLMMTLERIEYSGQPFFSTFYLQRVFRIYPLSMVCVGLIVAWHLPRAPWWPWSEVGVSTIVANLLLYTNLVYEPVVTSVLWSLPYEVQMYAVLPFLYLAGKRYGLKGLMGLWLVAGVGALIQPLISERLAIAQFVPCFLAGVASYFLGRRARRFPSVGLVLVILLAGVPLMYESVLGVSAKWLACLLVGFALPYIQELQLTWLRTAVAWIARYSYGIYLTHLYALWIAFVVLNDYPLGVRWLVLLVLSAGLPVVLFHLIEAPMMALGVRLAGQLKHRRVSIPIALRVTSPEDASPR